METTPLWQQIVAVIILLAMCLFLTLDDEETDE